MNSRFVLPALVCFLLAGHGGVRADQDPGPADTTEGAANGPDATLDVGAGDTAEGATPGDAEAPAAVIPDAPPEEAGDGSAHSEGGADLANPETQPGNPTNLHEAAQLPPLDGVRVVVRRFESDGSLVPLSGVEVRRERYKKLGGMEGGTELIGAMTARTTEGGAVVFPAEGPPGVGESDSFVATWAGLEWEATATEGAAEWTVTVFPVTTATDHFRMGLQAFVELRDANFIVQQQYTLINDSLDAIDLSGGEGLRVPLLIHQVFGVPLNVGYLPTRTDNQRTRFEVIPPRGRIAVERGTLVYRGVVPPGRSVQIRASFAVPYAEDDTHALGLAAPFDLDDVRIAVVLPERSGLQAALGAPHRTAPRDIPGGEELWLIPSEAPKAGEALTLLLEHTPDRRAVVRVIASVLGVVVAFVISAIFFATRRRKRVA